MRARKARPGGGSLGLEEGGVGLGARGAAPNPARHLLIDSPLKTQDSGTAHGFKSVA